MFDKEQPIRFFCLPVDDSFEQGHVLHDETEGKQAGDHGNDGSNSTKLGKHVSNVVVLFGVDILSKIHS